MSDFAARLGDSALSALSEALRAGRLRPPFAGVSLYASMTTGLAGEP